MRTLFALLLLAFCFTTPLLAQVAAVNTGDSDIALRGYDPVAYFTQQSATPGDSTLTHTWNGATWQFSTSEHRDQFIASPEQFAPQFGGYCAWAISQNYTADADPEAWAIVDGQLFLNYNKAVQKRWSIERAENIRTGRTNWPTLHSTPDRQ
ncbi:MAG: YHS domain-containing (seleno)protein [Rhodothermales bacterium]